jgi:hypothetical protein
MKITNWAIIFVIIFVPFVVHMSIKKEMIKAAEENTSHYDRALQVAVQDSAKALLHNVQQEYESGYGSEKFTKANRSEAVKTFFKSLSINFNVENEAIGQGVLKSYVPVVAVVDYKGLYVYAIDEYKNQRQETVMEHVEMPLIPFSYTDEKGNILSFTLDDYVVAYDKEQNKWAEGFREEINSTLDIPLLNDAAQFENVRRQTILDIVQEQLEYYINRHNTYAKQFGVTYTFTLPILSGEDWENTIDDIGVISFLQGIPIGRVQEYNNYSLSGSRITKREDIYGTTINGIKYYFREDCNFNYQVDEVFANRKEAAVKGYMPKMCRE